MNASAEIITLRELLTAYLESLRPQVHPVMTDHVQKTLQSFEVALHVKIPREFTDVPERARPLFMLFRGTVDSLLALRTPLSGVLEGGLLFNRLDQTGESGKLVVEALHTAGEQARALRETELDVLENLMQIFLGGARPSATMDEVRATGLYPGKTPKDFDIFDHM